MPAAQITADDVTASLACLSDHPNSYDRQVFETIARMGSRRSPLTCAAISVYARVSPSTTNSVLRRITRRLRQGDAPIQVTHIVRGHSFYYHLAARS